MKYEIEDRKRRHRLGRRQGTVPARVCPTAETYQSHQTQMGIKGAELSGGLYTRLVLHDFLPQYPGHTAFVPGLSEYWATKSWTGSPMAALHRAILMMGKLNLVGAPRDIVLGLRALQDIYTTPIDLNEVSDGDDGDSDAELDGNRDAELDGDKDAELEGNRAPTRQIAPDQGQKQQERQETAKTSGSQYLVAPERGFSTSTHSETQPTLLWRWGPCATSRDAMRFLTAVI